MPSMLTLKVAVFLNLLLFSLFSIAAAPALKKGIVLIKKEHRLLSAAQKAINQDDLLQAEKLLLRFNKQKVSGVGRALSQQMLGVVYQTQSHYEKALRAYEQALSYKKLPRSSRVMLFEKIHKLSYFVKDWKKTVFWWLKWEKRVKPKAEDYLLVANAYQYQEKWALARRSLLKAIKLTPKPPQDWYKLLLSYEDKLLQPKDKIPLLNKLVDKYPNNEKYWLKLAKAYQKNGQTDQVANVLYSAYLIGALQSSVHTYWLANSFAVQKKPMLAANILLQGFKQNTIEHETKAKNTITRYLVSAKAYEQARVFIESNLDNDFDGRQWLAKLYFNLEQWQQAYDKANVFEKSATVSDSQLQLIMGLSSLHIGNTIQAKLHFNNVLGLDAKNSVAQYWMQNL